MENKNRKQNELFFSLVNLFIDADLGHYNEQKASICLYDVPNTEKSINIIKSKIDKITTKYKLVVLDNKSKISNVNILDIGL